MASLNYCPQCATARVGRFCAGCGVNLEEIAVALASVGPAPGPGAPAAGEPEIVTSVAPSGQVGLEYGDDFRPESDCHNCGTALQDGVCSLCSDS